MEALRRVKAAEAEWDAKLREARDESDRSTRRARDEAEATVKAVVAESETERSHRLDAGRASADAEAEAVRREGEKAANDLRNARGKRPGDRADELLGAVLGPYAHD